MKNYLSIISIITLYYILFLPSVYARSAIILGSRWEAPQWEIDYDANVTSYIADIITSYDVGYEVVNLWYGSETIEYNILLAATGLGYNYSISFYIGHGNKETVNGNLQWLIHDNSGGKVYDFEIIGSSYNRYVKFVILWSCFQGDVIGGTHLPGWNPYGMPLAWRIWWETPPSFDGYANPDGKGYTFIGFKGGAPFLSSYFGGVNQSCYKFVRYFYEGIFGHPNSGVSRSIQSALDFAAYKVWGINFSQCILYIGYDADGILSQMTVYGDGSMYIDSTPTGGGAGPYKEKP